MYKGVLIPVITPFNEDSEVDQIVLRELIDFYLKTKVQGLFVLGSSGQGPALSIEERRMVAEIIIEQVARRVPVIVLFVLHALNGTTGTACSAKWS